MLFRQRKIKQRFFSLENRWLRKEYDKSIKSWKVKRRWIGNVFFAFFIIENLRGIKFKLSGRRSLLKETVLFHICPNYIVELIATEYYQGERYKCIQKNHLTILRWDRCLELLYMLAQLYKLWLARFQSYWLSKPGKNHSITTLFCYCSPMQSASCQKQDPGPSPDQDGSYIYKYIKPFYMDLLEMNTKTFFLLT